MHGCHKYMVIVDSLNIAIFLTMATGLLSHICFRSSRASIRAVTYYASAPESLSITVVGFSLQISGS